MPRIKGGYRSTERNSAEVMIEDAGTAWVHFRAVLEPCVQRHSWVVLDKDAGMQWEFAVRLRELKLGLDNNLEG